MARLIQVIEAMESRGAGTVEDPCRTVRVLYSTDGDVLAEDDAMTKNRAQLYHNLDLCVPGDKRQVVAYRLWQAGDAETKRILAPLINGGLSNA